MAMRHLRLGDTTVDILLDGVFEASRDILIHNGGEAALASALARWGDRPFSVDVNVALLRGPRGVDLVDAGTGTTWGPGLGHARSALAACGVAPDAVDRVFLTHLHGDHAYGLLDGAAPYFPRADVVLPEAELAFYTDPAERARLPEARHGGFDVAAAVTAAYGQRLRPVPFGPVAPGVELVPLPGHTPGQGGFLVTGGGSTLLLLGDALHLEVEQAADPDFGTVYDLDPGLAAETRRAVLDRAAAEGWTVAGGHLSGFGRVARDGAGFRILPLS